MEELKEAPEVDDRSEDVHERGNEDKTEEEGKGDEDSRSKPPGRKRLFITFSVVFSFLLGRVSSPRPLVWITLSLCCARACLCRLF